MLCEKCNKNEANIRYTEIINGEKREMMLCENCSHKLGLDNISFNMPIDFSSFFGGLLDDEYYNSEEVMPLFQTVKELKCNNCNMTYDDFINIGKFGCEECYEVFSPKIESLLKRLHGDNKHLGRKSIHNTFKNVDLGSESMNKTKTSVGVDAHSDPQEGKKIDDNQQNKKINNKENKLQQLQKELKKAIADERYEDAAKIRDEIIKTRDIP